MVQMKGLTRVVLWGGHGWVAYLVVGGAEAAAHVLVVEHLHLEGEVLLELGGVRGGAPTFLMIMTRKGSLMPSVLFFSAGQVM